MDNQVYCTLHMSTPSLTVANLCPFVGQVFQDAIQSPSPAFRYFTSGFMPPLVKLKFSEPDGSRYISAMSNIIFSAEEQ